MVTVLGVDWMNQNSVHEQGAVLVKDGQIVAAMNEDRITRLKHDGRFPIQSIKEVFRISKIDPSTVDAVAIPEKSVRDDFLFGLKPSRTVRPRNIFRLPLIIKKWEFLKSILSSYGVNAPLHFTGHHPSHAAATYYPSGFKEATVVTIDGQGYNESATVNIGDANGIRRLAVTSHRHSPGFFYTKATCAAGFKANDEEYKVMGLASYGDPRVLYNRFSQFLQVDGLQFTGSSGEIVGSSNVNVHDGKIYAPCRYDTTYLNDNPMLRLGKGRKPEDIAAAAQKVLEERIAEFVKNAVEKTGIRNVCIGGGVAHNVKANAVVRGLDCVDSVFVFPNAGDPGLSAGAALEVCRKLMLEQGRTRAWKMEHAYFGSEYTDEEIEKEINVYGLRYEKLADPSKFAADAIASGNVIGWFQGKLEYGPRALGNRSVLADPRDPKMKDRINKQLKQRDWFMPFAPSMLYERIDEYLVDAEEAPFMIMAFKAKDGTKKEIPAVVHVDGTFRPQTVRKEANPKYWQLIKNFEKRTGVPVVLNTSFNKHGHVIVRTPADALDHLVWGCVELLVMGNYAVYRKFK